jgi:hypothetical protein
MYLQRAAACPAAQDAPPLRCRHPSVCRPRIALLLPPQAVTFLRRIKEVVEDPRRLLLGV